MSQTNDQTKEDCLDALRTAYDELGESPCIRTYRELWNADKVDVSLKVIKNRCGSWGKAKDAAGLEESTGGDGPQYTDQDCLEALRQAKRELGHSPATHEYKQQVDIDPSAWVIMDRFGSWNAAKEAAELETVEQWENTCSVDEDYFETLDSESAYWFGFLYADGSVVPHRDDGLYTKLDLASRDSEHVEKFAEAVESEHAVTTRQRKDGGSTSIQITNSDFSQHLIDRGIHPGDKQSIPSLKEEYRAPFLRGYFDGDGSISFPKTRSVTWSIDSVDAVRMSLFKKWLGGMGVRCSIVSESREELGYMQSHSLHIQHPKGVEQVYKHLWPDGRQTAPALDRKHELIASFVE